MKKHAVQIHLPVQKSEKLEGQGYYSIYSQLLTSFSPVEEESNKQELKGVNDNA